jgi:hypothetical protein
MLFLVGGLLGLLGGGAIVVRYLRHEVAGDIGPRLRHLQLQLDNLEAAVNLALMTRYAELSKLSSSDHPQRGYKPDGGS